MHASASGQASSTSSTGITPSPSGTDTGPEAGSSHERQAVLEVEDLDRRRETSGGGRDVVSDAERVGRVEADAQVVRPARRSRSSSSAVRSPWFSSASRSPWSRAAAHASRSRPSESTGVPAAMRRPARHDPHHREPELRRGLEPVQRGPGAPRCARRTRGPRGAPHDRPTATPSASSTIRGGGELGRRRRGSSSAGGRSRGRAVAPPPRRRASREGRRAAAASRRAGPRRAGGGTRSCRRRREPASAPLRRRARDVVVLASVPAMLLGFGEPCGTFLESILGGPWRRPPSRSRRRP